MNAIYNNNECMECVCISIIRIIYLNECCLIFELQRRRCMCVPEVVYLPNTVVANMPIEMIHSEMYIKNRCVGKNESRWHIM